MKVNVNLSITKDDGTEFSTANHSWSGMTRDEVTYFEGMMIKLLHDLNQISQKMNSEGKGSQK